MRVIDLLNKIANGEEVPKHVRYYNMIENIDDIMYVCKENIFCKLDTLQIHLNSRVEIIEEPQKHKIPDKIFLNQDYGSCYIDPYSYEQVPLKREKLSPEEVSIINKINEILDYLEEKE